MVDLLRTARSGQPYEVRTRRRIPMQSRRDLDAATYSWVTPDYVLGTAPAVDGMALAVSGGQEIQATLFPEGDRFAPLYLWSRVNEPRGRRWRSRAGQEQAAGWRKLAVARMGTPQEPGHAWLSPPWSRPQPAGGGGANGGAGDAGREDSGGSESGGADAGAGGAGGGDVLVARFGGVYVALVTEGGWDVQPAPRRFPDYYGDKASRGSWVAVPRRQPAAIGLEVARASEVESWEAWRRAAAGLRLTVKRGESAGAGDGAGAGAGDGRDAGAGSGAANAAAGGGEPPSGDRAAQRRRQRRPGRGAVPELLDLRSTEGRRLVFRPGVSATLDGRSLSPADWPLHASPFLAKEPAGGWLFERGDVRYRFTPLPPTLLPPTEQPTPRSDGGGPVPRSEEAGSPPR